MTKIAVFGGSFDPPHIGHLYIIKEALEILEIEKLFLIPTFLNPFKTHSFFTPQQRLQWLNKIIHDKRVEILDFEIKQNQATPTIKTILHLEKTYHPKHIYLLIGADNLEKLPLWDSYLVLKNKVEFVIIPRKGYEIPKDYKVLDCKKIDISSTHIRELLKKKDKSVLDFIPKALHNDFI